MVKIKELAHYTQQIMQADGFKDYCPNGLQVEGKEEVRKIVTGVTASMALLEAAQCANADLILVHHGYFWRNEDLRVVGIKRSRLAFLLKNDLNLVAYHLPLDVHPQFGNNAQLGKLLGIEDIAYTGDSGMIAYGCLKQPMLLSDFARHVEKTLQRTPMVIGNSQKWMHRIAWCTGAAQSYMNSAIEMGVDVFISGEISEQITHLVAESGVSYIAAGHHATERYGIQALGIHLAEKFNLEHEFIDIENKV